MSTENAGLCFINVQCSFCKVSEKKRKVYLLRADKQYLVYGRERFVVCNRLTRVDFPEKEIWGSISR